MSCGIEKDECFTIEFDVKNIPVFYLNRSCGACPEVNDIYILDNYDNLQYIGYSRVRWGGHSICDASGNLIVSRNIKGDGLFDYEERDHELKVACAEIWKKYNETTGMTDEEYFQ